MLSFRSAETKRRFEEFRRDGSSIALAPRKTGHVPLTLYKPPPEYRGGTSFVVGSQDFFEVEGGSMKKCLFVFAACVLWATASQATTITLSAFLSGANENPATPSLGTGLAIVTLDDIAQTMRVQVSFSGLTSNNVAAHIHCCAVPPANAGVATVTPTFTGFPSGTTSGTYDHTFNLLDPASYNPAFITAQGGLANANAALINGLENNMTYLNIHTVNFGGGEIRGFLTPAPIAAIPEPASLLLLGTGLVGAGLRRYRRRR